MGKVRREKAGVGKVGGEGKAKKDNGQITKQNHGQIPRPLVCHPSVQQHSEILKHALEAVPKRLRLAQNGWTHMERKRMIIEDRISSLQMHVKRLAEIPPQIVIEERVVEQTVIVEKVIVQEKVVVQEKIVYVDRTPASANSHTNRPEPKFQAGQSVHQWWATWMPGAKVALGSIGKKGRPAWYSACVMHPPEWAETAYGGIGVTSWAYRVF